MWNSSKNDTAVSKQSLKDAPSVCEHACYSKQIHIRRVAGRATLTPPSPAPLRYPGARHQPAAQHHCGYTGQLRFVNEWVRTRRLSLKERNLNTDGGQLDFFCLLRKMVEKCLLSLYFISLFCLLTDIQLSNYNHQRKSGPGEGRQMINKVQFAELIDEFQGLSNSWSWHRSLFHPTSGWS